MAIVLSLLSALAYGVSDFFGGIFSRQASAWQVAVVGQASSGVLSIAAAVAIGGSPTSADLMFGALAGCGGGIGAAVLYRGLSTARMGLVAPISAVGTALLPVAVGVASGERPSGAVVVGVVLAVPAIALISRVVDATPTHRNGVLDGVLAGLGFGLLFVFLGQIGDDAGLYPMAVSQIASVASVIVTAMLLRQPWVPRDRAAWAAVALGPLGATAQGCFLVATHTGLLSVVAVICSLYPAATVVLAAAVLHENIQRWQAVGLVTAAVAVALVATG